MNICTTTYDALAACVNYPRPNLPEVADAAAAAVKNEVADTEVAEALTNALGELRDWALSAGEAATQERYTQLFDLKPVATLNVSHHLLGDTYQRGAVLAGLAGELTRAGIEHDHDLPDFLPTLLRLVGRLDDADDRRILVHTIILPGLNKVAEKLEPSPGPYPPLLKCLSDLLASAVPAGDDEVLEFRAPLENEPCSM